jgi:hypothetical protein
MWSSNGTTMAAGSVVMHPALRVCRIGSTSGF